MPKITPSQLAFLMGISVQDALDIIFYCVNKHGKIRLTDPIEIDLQIIEQIKGIPLSMAIDDLRQNALKRPYFRGWLIQYPLRKLKLNDAGTYPTRISLPSALRSILTDEQKGSLKQIWQERYSGLVDAKIDFSP